MYKQTIILYWWQVYWFC